MNLRRSLFDPGKPGPVRGLGLLLLRLAVGGMLAATHGLGKLQDLLGGRTDFPDPLGIGGYPSLLLIVFAEFFCGVLVALGLAGRVAAVPPAIAMAVAFFVYHAGDPIPERELALLYLAGFLVLVFTGPGRYSIDALIRRR